jgi:hypothetical protein
MNKEQQEQVTELVAMYRECLEEQIEDQDERGVRVKTGLRAGPNEFA